MATTKPESYSLLRKVFQSLKDFKHKLKRNFYLCTRLPTPAISVKTTQDFYKK